jgi:hypothetical protein
MEIGSQERTVVDFLHKNGIKEEDKVRVYCLDGTYGDVIIKDIGAHGIFGDYTYGRQAGHRTYYPWTSVRNIVKD